MTALSAAPGVMNSQAHPQESHAAISDTGTPLSPSAISRKNSTSSQHPELSNEVAALSNKLIHAINHQTDLDDTLSDTRQKLHTAEERIIELERSAQEHQSLVDNRILVKWEEVENDTLRLRTNLADERRRRVQAENERKSIEQELETLTTSLFEEANQMVAAAKRDAQHDRESLERRNEQLQIQLKESEVLLASHQEQLAELKQAMSDLSAPRNDIEAFANGSTAPSTPALDGQEHAIRRLDIVNSETTPLDIENTVPAPPTHYSHLVSPVLRSDVPAFEDFYALMDVARRSGPPSRVTSGNYSSFSGLGLQNMSKLEQASLQGRFSSNGSNTSLSATNSLHSQSNTPTIPTSTNTSGASRDLPTIGIPLKETAFYKRTLLEDIEPTLRLDTAPGLSWLARRGVVSSMCDGKLIVEPMPMTMKGFHQPCSLCGENSRDTKARTHRFRTNESETAQRYPLCEYCLNRVRSTCDFLTFLRMIKDGHWRIDGAQAEILAWEESVRLRERMFWARIGGGVIPTLSRTRPESPKETEHSLRASAAEIRPNTPTPNEASMKGSSPFLRHEDPRLLTTSPPHTEPDKSSPVAETATRRSDDSSSSPEGVADAAKQSTSHEDRTNDADRAPTSQPPSQRIFERTRTDMDKSAKRHEGSVDSEANLVTNSIAKRAAMFERQMGQGSSPKAPVSSLRSHNVTKPTGR